MRNLNRVASGILGLALLAAGLLLTVETLVVSFRDRPWLLPLDTWHKSLTTTTLSSPWVLGISIVLGLVGATIVLAELIPWRPQRVRVDGAARGTGTRWRVARRTVEQRAARAAGTVGGVARASARVRGREGRWRVDVHALGDPDIRDEVGRAVRRDLDRLGADSGVPLKVALERPRQRG
jgi:hypothetical protein